LFFVAFNVLLSNSLISSYTEDIWIEFQTILTSSDVALDIIESLVKGAANSTDLAILTGHGASYIRETAARLKAASA
jgi:hypothetical protein